VDADLAERRKHSPITQARCIAFAIIGRHPNVLLDDEPLDDLLEDIAQAIVNGLPETK
jgi:ABC-type ATPase involved in cell division